MVFDKIKPNFADINTFREVDWNEYYKNTSRNIPLNVLDNRCTSVVVSYFIDTDHAGCKFIRPLFISIFTFMNRAPILWFSKRWDIVKLFTFGLDYINMHQSIDGIVTLVYKTKIMGMCIEDPNHIFL